MQTYSEFIFCILLILVYSAIHILQFTRHLISHSSVLQRVDNPALLVAVH